MRYRAVARAETSTRCLSLADKGERWDYDCFC